MKAATRWLVAILVSVAAVVLTLAGLYFYGCFKGLLSKPGGSTPGDSGARPKAANRRFGGPNCTPSFLQQQPDQAKDQSTERPDDTAQGTVQEPHVLNDEDWHYLNNRPQHYLNDGPQHYLNDEHHHYFNDPVNGRKAPYGNPAKDDSDRIGLRREGDESA